MRIRAARNEDWQACLELDVSYDTDAAWQMEEIRGEGEWGVRFREVRLPRKQHVIPPLLSDARLKGWQRRDGFWVAVERRRIAGYLGIVLEFDHRQARIADIGVAPEHRRGGIGTELLHHALDWCSRQDMDQVILECFPKAQPAIGFALKHGFTFCGYQDAYWPGQEVAIFMRKRLR